MSRLTELLADLQKEFSQGNRLERELSRADVDTSDLIKNDPALLTGLVTAVTLPYTGPNWLANFVTRGDDITRAVSKIYRTANKNMMKPPAPPKKEPLLPTLKKYIEDQKLADQRLMFQQMKLKNEIKNRPPVGSGSRVGTDVAGRMPMPQTKPPLTVVRGPRGPINIERPTQGNLDLTKLKDTGITSLGNRMNPRMREDLLRRRDRIQQDVFRIDSMQSKGEPVDMNRLFRLQDELEALNKTLK